MMGWLKEHPWLAGGIIVGVGLVLILMFRGRGAGASGSSGDATAYYNAEAASVASGNALAAQAINAQAMSAAAYSHDRASTTVGLAAIQAHSVETLGQQASNNTMARYGAAVKYSDTVFSNMTETEKSINYKPWSALFAQEMFGSQLPLDATYHGPAGQETMNPFVAKYLGWTGGIQPFQNAANGRPLPSNDELIDPNFRAIFGIGTAAPIWPQPAPVKTKTARTR